VSHTTIGRAPQGARPSRRRLGPWALTVAATAVSAYALDAVATAAGLLLVASHLLSGLEHWPALALLAISYAAWAAGLRVNLSANWSLLEQTGTSTNAFSKAAHDLTRLRTASVRARRLATATGYVATELAKEAPYYAGAFGAAAFSDSVSSTEAVVFLIGANLGAAAYEYGLARLTRSLLRRRSARCASFDTDWVPREYLADYYSEVEPDERETIAYFVEAMRHAEPGRPVLLFGVGPTLHHVFLAAGTASEIHLADYLPANLSEIARWIDREPGAHDWRPFVRYTLECEGVAAPTEEQITRREELARCKITRLVQADAGRSEPVQERYATVISAYCADSATGDHAVWRTFMHHIAGRVEPGGVFITSALRRCRSYLVGGKPFPSANVDEHDLHAVLEPGFEPASGSIEVRALPEHDEQGYTSIVLAWRRRRSCA
jgi:NNMT/PNMT/TEMT family protein